MSCMTTKNYELRLPSATFWIICSCEDKQSNFCEKYQNPVAGRMIKSFLTDGVAFSLSIPSRSPSPPTFTLTLTLGVTLILVLPTPPVWSNQHLDWLDLRWAKGGWGGGALLQSLQRTSWNLSFKIYPIDLSYDHILHSCPLSAASV